MLIVSWWKAKIPHLEILSLSLRLFLLIRSREGKYLRDSMLHLATNLVEQHCAFIPNHSEVRNILVYLDLVDLIVSLLVLHCCCQLEVSVFCQFWSH